MKYHYHLPFTDEETEAETETDPRSQSHQDLNVVLSDSKTRLLFWSWWCTVGKEGAGFEEEVDSLDCI